MNTTTDLPEPRFATAAAPFLEDCAVVELRDYRLHAGQRETLVDLFEREFVETQEACGMRVMAQFRDLDDDDRFVWLRGFADMAARRCGLEAFYGGPVWQRHRDAANATMVDSSDVRLLRPARPAWAAVTPASPRRRTDDFDDIDEVAHAPAAMVVLATLLRPDSIDAAALRVVERELLPAWRDAGVPPCAVFVTENAVNDFPRLPVRTEAQALVWLTRVPQAGAWEQAAARLADNPAWVRRALPALQRGAGATLTLRRLVPTRRSLMR
ncbi:MAG: NIPSNAP family protein [Burkholderiales bacterium]|nr:NIPSNAP family protein [Burkholderiales bacterium]